jgi:chromosome segregation ATPase
MTKCPFDNNEISATELDCGAHRSTTMSANPDPLVKALQLAQDQLDQRLAAFSGAKAEVSALSESLQSAAARVTDCQARLVSATQSVEKLKTLLGG